METIKFSQDNIRNDFFDCESLRDVIKNIDEQMRQCGRVVTKISVNGLLINEKEEERLSSTKVADIDSIEVETEKQDQIFNTSLETTRNFIQGLKQAALLLSDNFRKHPAANERQVFVQAISDCQLLTEALMVLKPNLMVVHKTLTDEKWLAGEKQFLQTLRELVAAYEAGDRTLVSDVLEYELSNTLDQWLEILGQSN